MEKRGYYEIIDHTAYRMGIKASAIAGNVQFNRLHWHDSLEIMCCIKGSFKINIQGTVYTLGEGDLVTINCGLSHEISDGTSGGLQLIFSVDKSLLHIEAEEEYLFATVGDFALERDHDDVEAVRADIASLASILMTEDSRESITTDYPCNALTSEPFTDVMKTEEQWYQYHMELYRILMFLSRHKRKAVKKNYPANPYAHFIQCVEIIHRDYEKPLCAKMLAEEVGFSEPTIYRLFQNHMGISFTNYLNSVRISAACGLIEHSDYNMTEIAQQCGFSSLSNYYRVFHQFTGMSPREYRKYRGTNHVLKKGLQKDILQLNWFQPFWELPYTYQDLKNLATYKKHL